MMHVTGRAIMSFCIALVAGGVAIKALSWPLKAGLFPLIVSIPVCCLAFVDSLLSLFEKGGSSEGSVDFKFSEGAEKAVERSRTVMIFVWIVAFFFLTLLVGFHVAVPVFVFFYLKLEGKESWTLSLIVTAVTWGAFYGLFVWFLNVPFMDGWVQQGLKAAGII
jgi:hypothetical protein